MKAPAARPVIDFSRVAELIRPHGAFVLLGLRGYYRDTKGAIGRNDRAIYDDAIIVVWPDGLRTFNANVDPGYYKPDVATLKGGSWVYKLGIHGLNRPASQRYQALVQAEPVTVHRDGRGDDTGMFGINIHRGGYGSVSSAGCQTIYPAQWDEFITLVKQQMKASGQDHVIYVLVEEQG